MKLPVNLRVTLTTMGDGDEPFRGPDGKVDFLLYQDFPLSAEPSDTPADAVRKMNKAILSAVDLLRFIVDLSSVGLENEKNRSPEDKKGGAVTPPERNQT